MALLIYLTHFSPMSHFYTSWKCQKIYGFLKFSGGIEMWQWTKMGNIFSTQDICRDHLFRKQNFPKKQHWLGMKSRYHHEMRRQFLNFDKKYTVFISILGFTLFFLIQFSKIWNYFNTQYCEQANIFTPVFFIYPIIKYHGAEESEKRKVRFAIK